MLNGKGRLLLKAAPVVSAAIAQMTGQMLARKTAFKFLCTFIIRIIHFGLVVLVRQEPYRCGGCPCREFQSAIPLW